MKRIYKKLKAPFLELERDIEREERVVGRKLGEEERALKEKLEKDEKILLTRAKYFFVFCVFMIVSVLIYYSGTHDEWLPLIALGITAGVFWTHSDNTGKIFMVAAASIGYAHEVIGGMEGWFVYTSGVFYQTPLWLIPGYAAMYWACYNLWKQGRKKYHVKETNFKILAISLVILSFVLDATVGHFRPTYWPYDLVMVGIILLLFKVRAERHLALVAWCMTTLDEFLGFVLGAWQHYSYAGQVSTLAGHVDITAPGFATGFSFIGLIPPYLLFLWISIRFTDYVRTRRKMLKREMALFAAAIGLKTYTWFTSSTILTAFLAGRLF